MLHNIFKSIIYLAAFALTGCGNRDGRYTTVEGNVWHTTMRVTYHSGRDLSEQIVAVTDSVERSLSPFLPQSRISQINRNMSAEADIHIYNVFAESQRISRLSGGAFDPTVAPLVNLWGFGYESGVTEPSQAQIDSCRELIGIAECSLRHDSMLMVKKAEGTQFNFSAITKGYGVDCVGAMLEREGIKDYMVEIGGEIAVRGVNPQGEKWHIQIDSPESGREGHEQLAVIEVSDCGIATSGNYRNYRDTKGGRIGHTISPMTGRPVVTNVLSATVIAPTTMTADAFATALMAMDANAAMAMIETQPSVEAMLVIAEADTLRTIKSKGFPIK